MQTLLVITSRPEDSKILLKYAIGLARDLQMSVHLMYIQDPNIYPTTMPGTMGNVSVQMQENLELIAANMKKVLKQQVQEIHKELSPDIPVDFSSRVGIVSLIATEISSENEIAAILLEGQEDKDHWSQTPTNMEIIRHVNCPVWIIPYNSVYQKFNEIIYAAGYNEADIATLKKLVLLTGKSSPHITALHISDNLNFEENVKETGFLEMVQAKTGYDKISVKILVEQRHDELAHMINDYAQQVNADLIVIMKENRDFFERIFKSGSAKKIIRHAKLPLLIFHERE